MANTNMNRQVIDIKSSAGVGKAPEPPQDASETSEGADAFSEGETLRQDSAEGIE